MAMGLHDDDVAFFLAADEPATYLQVLRPPFCPITSDVGCNDFRLRIVAVFLPWRSDANLQHGRPATGPVSLMNRGEGHCAPPCHQMCSNQGRAWEERHGPRAQTQGAVRAGCIVIHRWPRYWESGM